MSHADSQVSDDENNDEFNPVNENNEVIPPFYDDPEQMVRARNQRVREATRANQRAPVAQNGAAPRQQPQQPQPPQQPRPP
ncbi:unnamed protein product [Rhodiola kirilowii]